jgi:hypothetical protein
MRGGGSARPRLLRTSDRTRNKPGSTQKEPAAEKRGMRQIWAGCSGN